MGAGVPFLGPAGALVTLPTPAPGYTPAEEIRAGTHELLGGGNVQDRLGIRRRYALSWPYLSDDNYSTVRALVRQMGPYRYLDPLERNLLTPNQSNGTDDLRTTEGFSVFTQGTVASSTAQFRSGQRSLAWATGTALAATGRGVRFFTDVATIDATWTACRPSTTYTVSTYIRATATVSMQVGFNFYDAAGALVTSPSGAGVSVSTTDWTTRLSYTDTSPSTAAFVIGKSFNTTTTGAAITVYFDGAQIEEASSVNTWRIGAGTPSVVVDTFSPSVPLADGAGGFAYHEVELGLLEL